MVRDQQVVILIDRGLLDGSAYVDKENWQALLDDMGVSTIILRDNRYDGVLHMVTAADGADKFYAGLNNEARYETKEEAIEKDIKLRAAYMGHPRWFMLDNKNIDFNEKIARAKDRVQMILGRQTGNSFYKKFLLKKGTPAKGTTIPIELEENQHFEESVVIETFINYKTSEGRVIESSIEKKGSNRSFTYTHKILLEKSG